MPVRNVVFLLIVGALKMNLPVWKMGILLIIGEA